MLRLLKAPPRGLQGIAHQGPGVLNSSHEGHLVLVTRLEVQEVLGDLELVVGPGEVPYPQKCLEEVNFLELVVGSRLWVLP